MYIMSLFVLAFFLLEVICPGTKDGDPASRRKRSAL
jgi:hypothetical protein